MSGFGVYAIRNKVTGTIYVGSTTISFRSRRKDHWAKLNLNCHKNSRLQRSWNKYGPEAFEFVVLEEIDNPDLVLAREQHHLDIHFRKNCYNARPVAESNRGWVPSRETRRRMSDAVRRRPPMSEATRRQLSESCKGLVRNPWTAESRAKMSARRMGVKKPDGFGERMRQENVRRLENPGYREMLKAAAAKGRANRVLKPYSGIFLAPDGRRFESVVHLTRFCKGHSLTVSAMSEVVRGLRPHHKGWTYQNETPSADDSATDRVEE